MIFFFFLPKNHVHLLQRVTTSTLVGNLGTLEKNWKPHAVLFGMEVGLLSSALEMLTFKILGSRDGFLGRPRCVCHEDKDGLALALVTNVGIGDGFRWRMAMPRALFLFHRKKEKFRSGLVKQPDVAAKSCGHLCFLHGPVS